MGTIENKKLIKKFIEAVWNNGRVVLISNFVHKDYKVHTIGSDKTFNGIRFVGNNVKDCHSRFKDFNIIIEDMIAEKNKIVSRIKLHGDNKIMTEFVIHKVVNGKIIEALSLGSSWN